MKKIHKCENRTYPCKLSHSGFCLFGGNKIYNYGFVSGSAAYCHSIKKWISDMTECPKNTPRKRKEGT